MGVIMTEQKKKPLKINTIKAKLTEEFNFLKNVFSVLTIPSQAKDDDDNLGYEMVKGKNENEESNLPKRARTITELEERLEKLKSKSNFNLKTKLMKKSLTSKLNKKIKKKERLNKTHVKPVVDGPLLSTEKKEVKEKVAPNVAKPVFNNDGKLVFSKFDFANIGKKDKPSKVEKDPKKILENMEKQKEKFRQLEENEDTAKVQEIKEKMAWKSILQKAEGQKVKDDPILLKKSIKKMDQKKKHSKKAWDTRISNVEQKKQDRQKKRQENISKKKKEKKSKVHKAAAKRGRVVI
ncbi:hypothetical protein JYU34_011014 [Plutella xylostella]|uniref:Ribosomal RNA-processing protein 14/surfeit locus protein 6 C-terminal domain-containing protein n=1 Tax=Plutella xylostella TaxID=51655 RepID=A0ABQ7QH48_PLUXY|nr:hypothetical protein JYU34_011014 [Plutella xylostella]